MIIVPNNCKDKTFQVAEKFAENKKQVSVLNLPFYTGKGKAVMEGFKIAEGDFIGFTDADNSTNPENFFKLFRTIQNFDGVIASRRIKGAIVRPKRKPNQEISSYLFNKFTNFFFHFNFKDTQCGAKLFTKRTAFLLAKKYTETGWIFDVDLLNICRKNKLRILECSIKWSDSDNSHLKLSHQFISPFQLLKLKFRG